jgi:hypothetical protein
MEECVKSTPFGYKTTLIQEKDAVVLRIPMDRPSSNYQRCQCWLCELLPDPFRPGLSFQKFHEELKEAVLYSADRVLNLVCPPPGSSYYVGHHQIAIFVQMYPHIWTPKHVNELISYNRVLAHYEPSDLQLLQVFHQVGVIPEKRVLLAFINNGRRWKILEWARPIYDLKIDSSLCDYIVNNFSNNHNECFWSLQSLHYQFNILPTCRIRWSEKPYYSVMNTNFYVALFQSQNEYTQRYHISGITIALAPLKIPSYVLLHIVYYLIEPNVLSEIEIMDIITLWNEGTKMSEKI